ncbi:hypothetical protein FQA39_LY18653 [Lamprigera yunnana]|nr:hypothetical protein FQA39_LY18653 [Lamprigera yunnana]
MTNSKHALRALAWACSAAAALALAGCGGSGSDDDDGGPIAPTSPTAYFVNSVVLPASATRAEAEAAQPLAGVVKTTRIVLPAIDTTKAEQAGLAGPAMQIGVPRSVAQTSTVAQTQAALQWQTLADGSQPPPSISNLPAPMACALAWRQEHPNAIVQTAGAQVNALLAQNRKAGEQGAAANTWWTPDVGTGNATLEIVLPAGTSTSAVQIAIPRVSHIYQNLSLPTEADMAEADALKAGAGACNLDATCTNNYQTERNAVARMRFTSGDGLTLLCTGTLLNNTKGDYAPYLLTANHCISTQSEASSLQTNWFYRSSSCNSGVPGTNAAVRNGAASLLYATAVNDMTLLSSTRWPSPGVTWLAGIAQSQQQTAPSTACTIRRADLLKYSVGRRDGFANCVASGVRQLHHRRLPAAPSTACSGARASREAGSSGSACSATGAWWARCMRVPAVACRPVRPIRMAALTRCSTTASGALQA